MKLIIVVAVAEDGAIGKGGALPWKLSADLQHFRRVTMGKPVIMGRRTWEELRGQPLKGRYNIILSRTLPEVPAGVHLSDNLAAAVLAAETEGFAEAAVIGGSSLFAEALPRASVLYLTRVHTRVPDADTFFPPVDMSQWTLAWEEGHEADAKNEHAYTFQRWERL